MKHLLAAMLVVVATRAGATDLRPPGLEMLDYLGQWREEDEPVLEWMDPVGLYRTGLLERVCPEEDGCEAKHEERDRK